MNRAKPLSPFEGDVLLACQRLVGEGAYPTGELLAEALKGGDRELLERIRNKLFRRGLLNVPPGLAHRRSNQDDTWKQHEPPEDYTKGVELRLAQTRRLKVKARARRIKANARRFAEAECRRNAERLAQEAALMFEFQAEEITEEE